MNKITTFSPNWNSAPGNTIKEILNEKGIPKSEFAQRMGITNNNIDKLLVGEIVIDFEIAEKLRCILGSSVDFWVNRESFYRSNLKRQEQEKIEWLKNLPVNDMINLGWIKKTNDIYKTCLDFFDVKDINAWNIKYNLEISNSFFKKSSTFYSDKGATAAWLRQGEIIIKNYPCKKWDKELFIETIEKIKPLTRKKAPKDFLPEMIKLCSECGVAVAILPTPTGCRASGATKFISNEKALLMLSFRYLSDDHFWFTFFHEAGHLVLHDKKIVRLESIEKKEYMGDEENEANIFAAETLIPYAFHDSLRKLKRNKRDIISFANYLGISPGLIVGQLQYLGIIKYSYLNGYKRRYDWGDINSVFRAIHE